VNRRTDSSRTRGPGVPEKRGNQCGMRMADCGMIEAVRRKAEGGQETRRAGDNRMRNDECGVRNDQGEPPAERSRKQGTREEGPAIVGASRPATERSPPNPEPFCPRENRPRKGKWGSGARGVGTEYDGRSRAGSTLPVVTVVCSFPISNSRPPRKSRVAGGQGERTNRLNGECGMGNAERGITCAEWRRIVLMAGR
jgi:hypothetical protein